MQNGSSDSEPSWCEIECKSMLTLPIRERLRVRLLLRDGHKPNMLCSTVGSGGGGAAIVVAKTSNDLTVFTGLDR